MRPVDSNELLARLRTQVKRKRYTDHLRTRLKETVEMTILAFAEAVQRHVGSRCPIEHRPLPEDDPRVRKPDIARAREVLGWEPKVDFGALVNMMVDEDLAQAERDKRANG